MGPGITMRILLKNLPILIDLENVAKSFKGFIYVTEEFLEGIEEEDRFVSSGEPIEIGDTILFGYKLDNNEKLTPLRYKKSEIGTTYSYNDDLINNFVRHIITNKDGSQSNW